MNALSSLKLYELTRTFIKDKEKAKAFVEKIEATVDDKMEQRFEHLATKSDLAALKVELMDMLFRQKEELMGSSNRQREELMGVIHTQKEELMGVINTQKEELMGLSNQQREEFKNDLASLRLEVRDQRTELIKSIYLVGLIQFLAIVGSVLAIVTFMLR